MIQDFLDWAEYNKTLNESGIVYGGLFLALAIVIVLVVRWMIKDIIN